jgi:fibronectin type 3 domain-containing protein
VVMLSGTGTQAAHKVTLSWAAPTKSPVPVSGYNVYRAAASSSSFQLLNAYAVAQPSYVDQNVVTGSSYSYYVKSVDSDGTESTDSNHVSVTVP